MKHLTIIIYLFFIQRNGQFNQTFFDEIFHFHRFLTIAHQKTWKRLFTLEDSEVIDAEYKQVIQTLKFHQLLTPSNTITEKGRLFLKERQKEDPELTEFFSSFLAQYKNQTAKEDSCYINKREFMMSCHACSDQLCHNLNVNFKDFLSLVGFKGFKTPTKSWPIKNPHS